MSASNLRRQLAFIPEVTFGVTPLTPQTQIVEYTGFDLSVNSDQLNSANINSHRQVSFSRRGNTSAEGSLAIELAPDNYDAFLEATLGGTWTTNVLKVGNTARSFVFEEGFLDIGQFQVHNGVTFNTLSVEVTPENLVTASFGLIGANSTALTGTSIDVTPTAVTAKPSFFHEGGTITEGGSSIAFITGIAFELTNNFTGNYAIGNSAFRSMTPGRTEVTGTVTALFESAALYNKYRNSTVSSLSFTLTAGSPAETLQFTFPDVRYTSGTLQRGESGPVLVELGFTAVYDVATATSLTITRSA